MRIPINDIRHDDDCSFGKIIKLPQDTALRVSENFKYLKQQAIIDVNYPVEIGHLQVNGNHTTFNQMERHEKTPELLIPLDGDFIIPVCTSFNKLPDLNSLIALRVRQGEALLLNRNCWHWMPCAVSGQMSILVIFRNNTSAEDIIIENLSEGCQMETTGISQNIN
jgi:ureidoglycolate hydrolase